MPLVFCLVDRYNRNSSCSTSTRGAFCYVVCYAYWNPKDLIACYNIVVMVQTRPFLHRYLPVCPAHYSYLDLEMVGCKAPVFYSICYRWRNAFLVL